MSAEVTGHSGGKGRRRPSYYRPRAAPLIRPRGQGDRTRPSSRVRDDCASDTADAASPHCSRSGDCAIRRWDRWKD
ncbi:unnamed protein product [Leptosia nina]|uniref:Uncharacterized protein n=1 Tax=Leptosia nina TaxID=320188 RepID=A0AAV1IYS9_9NEOP